MKKSNEKKTSRWIHLFLWPAMLLLCSVATAQVTISGKVTSAGNAAAGNVSVVVRNSNAGTSTDASGAYSFSANLKPGKYVLEFSGVGFKTTTSSLTVESGKNSYTVNAELSDDVLGLDEVVITGTGVATKKKQLGNAISTVSGRELTRGGATSIDMGLQGKVAGAQVTQNSGNPAGGITVRLRGPSTIVGSSDPLYIVDGVIVNNDSRQLIDLGGYAQNRLVDLNPADIDRIEIIKGAAAAAIYGSRANNGVVQIFTKKGREGKPQFSFSTQLRSSTLRKKMEYNKVPFRFANFTASDLTTVPVQRYDFQDKIFQNAIGTENVLSVSGGTANTKYYASVSNLFNEGIVRNTNFMRNGFRLNLQQKLNKSMTLNFNTAYTYSNSKEIPNGGINEAYGALTGFIFGNNYVNPDKDPATGIYPSVNASGIVARTNPLEAIERFDFRQRTSRIVSSAQLTYKPIAGLNIEFTSGIDNYTQTATAYIPPRNTTPSYNGGFIRRADATVIQLNNDLTATYQKEIASELQSTTSLGGTLQYDKTFTFSANATQLGAFGQTINNGTIAAGEFRGERVIMGAFLQQTFGYKNRYFVTGAARVDASSVYGIDNRWQFFPKVSGTYIVSNEKFWGDHLSKAVSSLKLRAAYGQSGNLTAIGQYDRFTNFSPVVYGGQAGYIAPSTLGNFTVKPERQTEVELGFDLGLLNDAISVEFSYFNKDVKDLILNRTLAPTTGYNNRFVNIGTMTNKGFEFLVRAAILNNDKLRWVSTLSYLNNKNVVNGVEGNGVLPFAGGFGQVAAVNGYPLGAYYSTFFARNTDGSLLLDLNGLPQRERGIQLANGKYTVQRGSNGQPTGTLLSKVIGQPNPKHVISKIDELDFGKFNFRMQWDAMLGYDVFNFTKRVGDRDFYGGLKGYENELLGKVPKGTSAALFSIFENWIEDGSFVKLRELSLSYNMKPKFLKGNTMRLSVVGRNLLSFDKYSGWDPEVNAAGQDNAVRGFDFVEVPIPRMILFGVNVNF
ncbi:TonB-linked SusC/RagA family outer membrane protein [Lacibacter cauensis]|uniref:TonB-linked SusC/RagA family outer membrane protein n=1 Tax=Lacibacter cauensis TaxID=510947 RepID=A0A562SFX1_9BACT|nr:SusC/RagA family TonB-linked outer membrane protein [Lacibacter cauensis]TWI80231.1 TonB-linked SusC/RagA family outer membrane protein [Lacibacter cauensis]